MKTYRILPVALLLALALTACQSDMDQTSTQLALAVDSNAASISMVKPNIAWPDYVVRSNFALKKIDAPWQLPVEISGTKMQTRHDIRLSQNMHLQAKHENTGEILQHLNIQWQPSNSPHLAREEAKQLAVLLQAASPNIEIQKIETMVYQLLRDWQIPPKTEWSKAWHVDEQVYQVAVSPHLGIQVKTEW